MKAHLVIGVWVIWSCCLVSPSPSYRSFTEDYYDGASALIRPGAVLLGLYEVVYKMALPEGHGGVDTPPDPSDYEILPTHHDDDNDDIALATGSSLPTITETSPPDSPPDTPKPHYDLSIGNGHPPIYSDRQSVDSQRPSAARKTSRSPLLNPISISTPNHTQSVLSSGTGLQYPRYSSDEPPVLPTALHSNFITSCIGFATLVMLWFPIIILHWTSVESFRWPGSNGGDAGVIWWALVVVAACGAIYVRP